MPSALAADPLELGTAEDDLPPQEQARRERVREQAGGIVGYACDRDLRLAVFALSGRVYVADLTAAEPSVREVACGTRRLIRAPIRTAGASRTSATARCGSPTCPYWRSLSVTWATAPRVP